MKPLLLLLAVSCMAVYSKAQQTSVTIPGSQIKKITSAIVNGQEYELQILLPGGYGAANKKYPVVYVMDAQWDFPLVKSIYGQQYYDGFIPEMIIVGVTWGGINPNPDSLRARDYTPTNEQRLVQSGGADQFLDFMKKELFPFIENNYKAESANRTLMGCSLGGLFTIYTLFTHGDMFTGYAAASPAVGWDNDILYKYEKAFAVQKTGKPARLYITVGDVERNRGTFEKFSNYISSKHYANLSVRSKVLENTGHSGTKSETYSRGLQFIFERPHIKLDEGILKKYTGTYTSAGGNTIEIKSVNHQLVLYFSPADGYPLKAASANLLYSNAALLNLEFSADIKTLQLNRYGSSERFSKK